MKRVSKSKVFEVCGYNPHSKQKNIHDSYARFRIISAGRRGGKSKCAAMEAVCALLKPDQMGWIVSPSYALSEKIFREIFWLFQRNKVLKQFVEKSSFTKQSMQIILKNGSMLLGKSADNPEGLLGEGLNFLIIDEAARVKEMIWDEALRPTLADKEGWLLAISTPKGRNWFHKLFVRGADPEQVEYMSWTFPTSDNPHIAESEIELANQTTPLKTFRQEWLAEFISDVGGVFHGVRDCIRTGGFKKAIHGVKTYSIGVDLAKYEDFTVIVVMCNEDKDVVHFERFNRIDWAFQKEKIKHITEQFSNYKMWVDATGIGDAIFEDLHRAGLNVVPFKFTSSTKQQLIDKLALGIQKREMTFPEIPEMINELEVFEYSRSPSGHLRMQAPDSHTDDAVIALGLAWWGCAGAINSEFFVY